MKQKNWFFSLFLLFCTSLLITWLSSKPLGSWADSGEPGLRDLAQNRGIYIGTATQVAVLRENSQYRQTIAREFNSVTPENEMKFAWIAPNKAGEYNFTDADELVKFAQANGISIHAHTLIWHNQIPKWLTEGKFNREQLLAILKEHIQTVVGHFRGKIRVWDVVNEVFGDDGELSKTFWLKNIGPEYIPLAFQWAHEADPGASLILNDYGGEGLNPKSNGIYNYVQELKAKGVPIDGVGLQMHISVVYGPNELDLRDNIQRLGKLGLKVYITEMDVQIQKASGSRADNLALQARIYANAVRGCLASKACQEITFWGFTDKYSWIPAFTGNADAPLLFDENFQQKSAYYAVKKVLQVGF